MKLEDLQAIDWNDFSQWPMAIKAVGVGIIAILILFAGFWFIIQDQLQEYKTAQEKEEKLKTTFTNKSKNDRNL